MVLTLNRCRDVPQRTWQSTPDKATAASVSGWSSIDLHHTDFWGANGATNWHFFKNWEGASVPDQNQHVFVRHGGDAILNNHTGYAGNLFVSGGSRVLTQDNLLDVFNDVTVEGGAGGNSEIQVQPNGVLEADEITLHEGGFLAVASDLSDPGVLSHFSVDAEKLTIDDGAGLLRWGRVKVDIVNNGTINAFNPIGAQSALSLNASDGGKLDLDGTSGNGKLFAVLGNLGILGEPLDAFDGELTIGADRGVKFLSILFCHYLHSLRMGRGA